MDPSSLQHRRHHHHQSDHWNESDDVQSAPSIHPLHPFEGEVSNPPRVSRRPALRRKRQRRSFSIHTPTEALRTRLLVLIVSIAIVLLLHSVHHQRRVASDLPPPRAKTTIPFVYMVHDRIDYFRQSLESLIASDFLHLAHNPTVIVSHDSYEIMKDVATRGLKYPDLTIYQLVHPYSNLCRRAEENGSHPSSIGCAKHHFAWMLQGVSQLGRNTTMNHNDDEALFSAFVFLEEDYIVAPTIYETITSGMNLLSTHDDNSQPQQYFGLTLDPTNVLSPTLQQRWSDGWVRSNFVSGPMVLTYGMIRRFLENPIATNSFCTFDDYNWDWSLVHVMTKRLNEKDSFALLPRLTLAPSKPQVQHIGAVGMHHGGIASASFLRGRHHGLTSFHGTRLHIDANGDDIALVTTTQDDRGFGGWNDTQDVNHCLYVLQGNFE